MASAPLTDEQLTEWAREHLVYEGKMFAWTAIRLAKRRDQPRDPESNALLEAFAIHTRCLRDFLWGDRGRRHPMDAFASDFCEPGVWERERGPVPETLAEIDGRDRLGREVVHLTYHRMGVPPEIKDWPVSHIVNEVVETLAGFAYHALPERLDEATEEALNDLASPSEGVGPVSVATGFHGEYTGGTIELPDFTIGS